MKGIISGSLEWFTHPIKSDGNMMDWLAGFVLVCIAAFLWSTVVSAIAE